MNDSPYRDEEVPKIPKTLEEIMRKRLVPVPLKKVVTTIHSAEHELADQICKHFKEPKRFGMWLGIIKKYGTQHVYKSFAEVKQSNAKTPVMLLMWKLKQKKDGTELG